MVPEASTGRAPHDGDPLTALHLEALIDAVESVGVERFEFFNPDHADWAMLSDHGDRD